MIFTAVTLSTLYGAAKRMRGNKRGRKKNTTRDIILVEKGDFAGFRAALRLLSIGERLTAP